MERFGSMINLSTKYGNIFYPFQRILKNAVPIALTFASDIFVNFHQTKWHHSV
jgi:predicted Zn-dependent peptidase